jgi:phenylpropionate dioxygenase-like ring-hydroxylating dioxygenase large terminal subunit
MSPDVAPFRIPRRALFSDDVYAAELGAIFRTSWLFIGHESEVPDAGSYVKRRMGDDHVILVRNAAGDLNVLLNSCSHRGTPLCRADVGQASHLRCMYHGWTYDTDGKLLALPGLRQWYPDDFDRAEHSLPSARTATWNGLVFATWNFDGPTLEEFIGEFAFYLGGLLARPSDGWELMGDPIKLISHSNWKLAAENFGMDSLHLESLHPTVEKLGIFTTGGAVPTAYTVVCEGGHGITAIKLPDGEPGRFPGYPEELWSDFAANQTSAQTWFTSNNMVSKGNLFPNLNFLDALHPFTGDADKPPVAATLLRQSHPIDARTTEIWMWILVPRSAPANWKRWSQEVMVRTVSVSGVMEPDDLENAMAVGEVNLGSVARERDFLYFAGANVKPVHSSGDHQLPGDVHVSNMNTETMVRGFFSEWYHRMGPLAASS